MTITYSVDTGALPAGLALDATTGAITGVPTQAGSWSFSVRATIATHTPLSNTTVVTIEITDPSPIWTDQVLGGMTAGVPYSDSVNAASQYAVTYSVTAGALPTGLVLNSATGEITGTPATPGAYAFTILASSAGGDTLVDFAGSIAANPPVFFDSTVGSAQIAVSYSDGISASSYAAVTYAITAGSLPAGLVLDSTTGAITGTPTVVGSFTVTITATSDGGSAAITITITVAGDAPVWNDQTVSGGTAGAAYNDGVTTTSILPVTYSVTAGSLPAGLVLDPTTGAITGTPATAGTYTFTVTATSDAGTVSVELTIAVTAPAIDRRTTSVITGANTATLDFSGLTDATISVSPAKDTTQRTTGTSTVTNGIVSFTPDAGFSGKASVVVTIVRFGVTTTQTYEFTVIPAPATNVAANVTNSTTKWLNSRRANGSTVITWAASPNAVSYRVTVSRSVSASSSQANSTVLCSTTATSCALAMLLAEGTNVTVIAVGNDGTESVISTGAVRVGTAVVLSSMFRVDSWKLSATAKAELRALAATLKTAQATTITISGHGDARGGTYLNKWLSARRAAVVAGYLKAQLPGVKIVTKALGSSKPVASNDTAAGRALNRRAEITFR
jgi:outer membrane protein OmpA-like peptidoglycan-associated protein